MSVGRILALMAEVARMVLTTTFVPVYLDTQEKIVKQVS